MNSNEQFRLSYGVKETFEEKIERLERLSPITYNEILGFKDKENRYIKNYPLFHGLRFDGVNKLESIFQSDYVLCGKKCPNKYTSMDGTEHYLNINSIGFDNCNNGEYVSVIPYDYNSLEFNTFIAENLFLAFTGNIDAISTFYLKYDDYCMLKESNKKLNNLYSYAFNEYMVKDKISLDDLLYIGINSNYYNGNIDETIEKVIELLKYYKIEVPLIDTKNDRIIYETNKKYIKI